MVRHGQCIFGQVFYQLLFNCQRGTRTRKAQPIGHPEYMCVYRNSRGIKNYRSNDIGGFAANTRQLLQSTTMYRGS